MWHLTRKSEKECQDVQDALERNTTTELPDNVRAHLASCSECRIFADELVEARAMLQGDLGGPQPGPFFLARVMASIADREGELEKSSQTWAAVPRLAYRLSVLAALTLLVAASWLYQPSTRKATTAAVNTEQSSEGLFEGGTTTVQDDFLLSAPD
jgi:anti-sigma factor RsiW